MTKQPKILLFDIETMADLGWFWQRYETNILSIKHGWYILSFAFKWLGEKSTQVYSLPDFKLHKTDKRNDKELCKVLWQVLHEADIVIAHYGDNFDLKKANARFIAHGLPPMKPVISIDTRKVAAKHFLFGSNKLNDLAQYFKIGEKVHTGGWQLWLDCAEYDKKEAWQRMRRYNKQDVELLEKVYLKLRPWIQRHPNINLINNKSSVSCPNCGGVNMQRRGFGFNQKTRYQRIQCQSCGAWTKEALPNEYTPANKGKIYYHGTPARKTITIG